MAGRVTLANSVLTSLPVYVMQSTYLPRSVCDDIDKKVRSFVWGSTPDHRKIHLLNWDKITRPRCEGGLGIRQMRSSNTALLAKLGWRLLQEPTAIWSLVLRSKYCHGRLDIDMFRKVSTQSPTWKGIVLSSPVLEEGLRMVVGNGRATFFWTHIWAGNTRLLDVALQPVALDDQGATVAELWTPNGWDWAKLQEMLPSDHLAKLASIRLVDREDAVDRFCWGLSSSGVFSSKSALALIHPPSTSPHSQLWRFIWKNPSQQRVRHFLFLAAHQCFLCNVNRVRRGLATSAACPRCSGVETCLHVLRDCPRVKLLWNELAGSTLPHAFFSSDIHVWLTLNIAKGDEWASQFAYMTWFVWKERNSLVFDNIDSLSSVVGKVKSVATDYRLARTNSKENRTATSASGQPPGWAPPDPPWLKLNTDGVSKGNPGTSGGGGLIRNSNGIFIRGFVFTCGACSAFRAELWAILHGLQLATEMGLSHLILECDCLTACRLLQETIASPHQDFFLLDQCRRLIRDSSWQVRIQWVPRQANSVADTLANWALVFNSSLSFFDFPPDCIQDLLSTSVVPDLSGKSYPN